MYPSNVNQRNGIGVPIFLQGVTNRLDSKCDVTNRLNPKCDQKSQTHFPGDSCPYTLGEIIQINGRRMAQIEKNAAPGLPKFIIVYFVNNYRGPTFFPGYPNRAGWVPIHPINAQWYIEPTKVGGNFE